MDIYRIVLPWEAKHLPFSERLGFILRGRQARRVLAATVAVLIVSLGGLAFWRYAGHPAAPIVPGGQQRIAVLPFVNMSGDADNEYFSDGITEELISRLSRIGGLEVIARTSVMSYKGTTKKVPEIGRELSVGSILEGSVRKAANRVRITVQLIHADNQAHLWSEDYDRDLTDIFAVQGDIAQRVANALRVKLVAAETQEIKKKGTQDPAAYTLYLKGLYHLYKRTKEGTEKSHNYFQQAREKDPTYAPAIAGLAFSYLWAQFFYLSPEEAYPKAKQAAEEALGIDETLADAHQALAWYKMEYEWDWTGSERELQRALALNPNQAGAHITYGMLLSNMGRHEEAKAELQRAQQVDPLSPVATEFVGWGFYLAREYDRQIEEFRRVEALDPNDSSVHWGLGAAYLNKDMYREAVVEFQKWVGLTGGPPLAYAALGCAYARSGQRDSALRVLQELKGRPLQSGNYQISLAWFYSCLGEKDHALESLEKAYSQRAGMLISLKVEPLYDGLRSDPRYAALLRKMGL